MIYEPTLGESIKLILDEIEHLSSIYDYGSSLTMLRSIIGKPAIHYVLRAVEHPFEHPRYENIRKHCMTLLKWYAQDEMMSMSELQRYRQIIISEKK